MLKITTLLVIIAGCISACNDPKPQPGRNENPEDTTQITDTTKIVCKFKNPLTDLPWLKEKIDEFNLLAQENPNLSIAIYQCTYGNEETGFLVDKGNTKPFYNCKGEVLCIMGGDAGETCLKLNIVSQELIWETKNNKPENPQINGVWEVKAISVSGELTNIGSPPNDAPYPNISITIPNTTQGYIDGNTFINWIGFDFEIKEYQQISFKNYGGSRSGEDDWGRAFQDHIMFNVVKFKVSNNELHFIDSQNNSVIVFINRLNKN